MEKFFLSMMTLDEALARGNQLWAVDYRKPGESLSLSVTMETYADAVDLAGVVQDLGCTHVFIHQVTAVNVREEEGNE